MNISENLKKTFAIILNNLTEIIIVLVVLGLIRFASLLILKSILGINTLSAFNKDNIMNYAVKIPLYYKVLEETIMLSILGANQMAILDLVRGKHYSLSLVKEKFVEKYSQILVVALIVAIITSVLGKVWIVGGILKIIAGLALAFSFYLIEDFEADSPLGYVKGSYELSKGHKLNLFLIKIIYSILPILLLLFLIIPSFIVGGLGLGILAIFGTALLSVLVEIITQVAMTIYYEENVIE